MSRSLCKHESEECGLKAQYVVCCACAHGRPAGLSASILQLAADAMLFSQQLLMSATLLDCNNSLCDASQCIAQPTTTLHDSILSLPEHLRSRHFMGLCKSVYPWGHVSEIRDTVKNELCQPLLLGNA